MVNGNSFKGQNMDIHPELGSAIERNANWLKRRAKVAEANFHHNQDLMQDIVFNLHTSNKSFCKNTIDSADAWVKRVASNVCVSHIQQRIMDKKSSQFEAIERTGDLRTTVSCKAEYYTDLMVALSYVNTTFRTVDREIMLLYLMKEDQQSISEIVGMKVESVRNRIGILKAQLNDYLNFGDHNAQ